MHSFRHVQDYWQKTCLMPYALYSKFSQSSLLAVALIFLLCFCLFLFEVLRLVSDTPQWQMHMYSWVLRATLTFEAKNISQVCLKGLKPEARLELQVRNPLWWYCVDEEEEMGRWRDAGRIVAWAAAYIRTVKAMIGRTDWLGSSRTCVVNFINFRTVRCIPHGLQSLRCSFFCLSWNKLWVLTDMRVNARFISRWTFPLRLMVSVIGQRKRTGSCLWLLNHILRESLMPLLKQSMSSCNRKWPSYFL